MNRGAKREQIDRSEKFRWNLLGDAIEDYWALWEVLAKTKSVMGAKSDAERRDVAENALRALYAEGLLYFFRVPSDQDPRAAGEDESLRLRPQEVEEAISGDWMGTHRWVWLGPTPAGEAAVQNPPHHIRRLWGLDVSS